MAVSRERPLSEDLLKYTPKGSNCKIPVTAAVNIAHDKSESEIDRKLKAHSPSSNRYLDLVTLEGVLKLHNFEKETVYIIIVASVPGKPLVASDDGLVQAGPTKLKLTERRGSVPWKIKLEPGKSKTLTYKYKRYVPLGWPLPLIELDHCCQDKGIIYTLDLVNCHKTQMDLYTIFL